MSNNRQEITADAQREEFIQKLAETLRNNAFTFSFVVKKKPEGIKIIYEVTREDMDRMTKKEG